jgi:putative transposase
MKLIDPITGRPYFEKRRRRYHEPGQPRELTFSCYPHYAFLTRGRTREWFREALESSRREFRLQLWAYVVMPEHVHLFVVPNTRVTGGIAGPLEQCPLLGTPYEAPSNCSDDPIPKFLQALKEPVARQAIAYLRTAAPEWLERLQVTEGRRTRYRFWQPGGGYDRNVTGTVALRTMIEYIHANPVRRGLVARAEDWEWSSARWYAGIRPAWIEIDDQVLVELARG